MAYGSFLAQVGTTFHFRYTLPPWTLGNPKPLQLKRSLGVHDMKLAKKFTRFLASQMDLFLTTSNLGLIDMNQEERKKVLFQYLEQQIQEWKSIHSNGPRLTREQHNERVNDAKNLKREVLWDIQSSNLKPSLKKVKDLYQQLGINDNADKNDAYDFAQTEVLFHQFVEMTLSGNPELANRMIERNKPSDPVPMVQQKPSEPLISILIQEYLDENKTSWARKTFEAYQVDLQNCFLANIEDKPINQFTKQDFLSYREKLKTLPKHGKKGAAIISARRANNIIGNISTFFKWCNIERDVIDGNIAQGKSLPTPKAEKNKESRERFTKEDLVKIFSDKLFTKPDSRKLNYYWVPILAYYTGARLAELSLLKKEDIYQTKEGVWTISINEKHRTLKNKTSIRDIPIHDDVLKLGFIEYVQNCKTEDIFESSSIHKRHDDAIGKRFGRLKKSLGFPDSKVFHCFRNTFIDEVFQQGLDPLLYKDFVGHGQKDITHGTYASRASVHRLKEGLLDKMVFPVSLPELLNPGQATEPKKRRGRPRKLPLPT